MPPNWKPPTRRVPRIRGMINLKMQVYVLRSQTFFRQVIVITDFLGTLHTALFRSSFFYELLR